MSTPGKVCNLGDQPELNGVDRGTKLSRLITILCKMSELIPKELKIEIHAMHMLTICTIIRYAWLKFSSSSSWKKFLEFSVISVRDSNN